MTSLLDRLDNRLDVHWFDRPQIDDFGVNAVLLVQFFRSSQGLTHTSRKRDNGQVLARPLDLGFAKGKDEVILLRGFAQWKYLTVE